MPYKPASGRAGFVQPRGHILHDILEGRVMPDLVGPVDRGTLQYTAVWRAAQRLTARPVKFGTITPELIAMASETSTTRTSGRRSWRSATR